MLLLSCILMKNFRWENDRRRGGKDTFYYMYSDSDYYDYDTLVARTVQGEQSMYVYQLPGDAEYPYVRICHAKV